MGKLLQTSLLFSVTPRLKVCVFRPSHGTTPRVDIFGRAPDQSIWHKFYTGYDWQPDQFERIPSESAGCPSVSSWDYGRLDLVWVDNSNKTVLHKYFDDGWGPSWEGAVDLGGSGDIYAVDTHSWGPARLDIVGNAPNGTYLHKAWTGADYYPTGKAWEDLGGNFSSPPSIGSWGQRRLDIIGISAETGSLLYKFWDGARWFDWEDLGGGPFIGRPVISSWGQDRLDFWALGKDAALYHKFWDGFQWNGWEKLGGKFSQTPQVVHWSKGRIDIVGKYIDDDRYHLKSYDGYNWNPPVKDWWDLSGPYVSEPQLLIKADGQNFLYLFGVDTESILRMQIWSGYEWQPSDHETWPLGNVSKPYPAEKANNLDSEDQYVLVNAEL
ncbi:hypothetical protein CIB48_g10006 [Xylaria polymorpha]|nr:hypothetical protein CIB48_g10006 [Xylaria polymorpha]